MKKKLTSRKFWLAVAGLIVGVLAMFGVPGNLTSQISGVIMSLGSVIAYIAGEGLVDAANATNSSLVTSDVTTGPVVGTIADTAAATTAATGTAQADQTQQVTSGLSK